MEIFNATEEKGLSRCTEKWGGGDDAWRGGQERRLRVMRKAIVEGIKGREYGRQAAKVAVGACVPGYARSGRKNVSRQPGEECIAWR